MLGSSPAPGKHKQQPDIPASIGKSFTPAPEVWDGSGGTHQCRACRNHSALQGATFANSTPNESTAKAWLQSDLDEAKTLGGLSEAGGIW